MTSLLVTGTGTPAYGLPVARLADPDECETVLLVDAERRDGTTVVRARGEVDLLTVTQLRAALDGCLTTGAGTVVADLREVSFIDCAGVGELVAARRRARRRGVALEIRPGRAVARVAALLEMTAVLGLPGR
jgi:anti-anti-sigma factor